MEVFDGGRSEGVRISCVPLDTKVSPQGQTDPVGWLMVF